MGRRAGACFGKCQTRRSCLISNDSRVDTTGVPSLILIFSEDPDDEVLCQFLGLIGGSLQSVTIQVSTFHTPMLERITANCPQLREIAICTSAIDVRFQVRDNRLQNPITVHPLVPSSFKVIKELLAVFCVNDLPFSMGVRRLRVRIERNYDDDTVAPPLEDFCILLLFVLRCNCTLEYLDVELPNFNVHVLFAMLFKKCHLEKLPVVKDELPTKSKLGFLSVMAPENWKSKQAGSSRRLIELDRNTIDLIFNFAATPAVRKVYFGRYGLWNRSNQFRSKWQV